MKIKVGDKIRVKSKTHGSKLCTIDSTDDKRTHFKNKSGYGLTINTNRINKLMIPWRGATLEYISIN